MDITDSQLRKAVQDFIANTYPEMLPEEQARVEAIVKDPDAYMDSLMDERVRYSAWFWLTQTLPNTVAYRKSQQD